MPSDTSLDLVGVGRAMDALPKEAWLELVQTATGAFKSIIHPLTATTGGVGRWIDQKFDNKVDVEKVLLADGLSKAMQRIAASSRSVSSSPNLPVIAPMIEGVSLANKPETREMWINLLARGLSGEEVHPEFINVLNRLSPDDARLLLELFRDADGAQALFRKRRSRERAQHPTTGPVTPVHRQMGRPFDLSEEILTSLNLLEPFPSRVLSEFGDRFLEAVGELKPPSH